MGYVLAVAKDTNEDEVRRVGDILPNKLIVTVSSIDKAKRIVSGIVPDAVLIAPELDDGSGSEFFDFLLNHPRLSKVPVITLARRYTSLLGHVMPALMRRGSLSPT